MRLRHLLQHEHVTVEVRLQRRAEQVAEDRHVECRRLVRATDRRLQRFGCPIDDPGERPPDRRVAAVPEDVLHHRTMRHRIEAGAIERRKQHTAIAVAQIGFPSGRSRQSGHDGLHHAAGAVTAAREPHRVVTFVIGDVEEGLCARFVIAGEMPVRSKALGMEENLRPPVRIQRSGQRLHSFGDLQQTFAKPARQRRS